MVGGQRYIPKVVLLALLVFVISCQPHHPNDLLGKGINNFPWFRDVVAESPDGAQALVNAKIGEIGWKFIDEGVDFGETGNSDFPLSANRVILYEGPGRREQKLILERKLLIYDDRRAEWMPVGEILYQKTAKGWVIRRQADVWSGDYGSYERPEQKTRRALAEFLGMTEDELRDWLASLRKRNSTVAEPGNDFIKWLWP